MARSIGNCPDRQPGAPRRHDLIAKIVSRSSALLACICWLAIALASCGAGGRTTSASSASVSSGPTAPASGPHAFGDYDSDEYLARPAGGDGDNDDRPKKDRDNDGDNERGSYFDTDDSLSLEYGYRTTKADRRAIGSLVERYYALAAAHDGSTACGLLAVPLAGAVPRTIGAPWYFHGKTCGEVMTKVFEASSHQFAAYASSMKIASVGTYRGEGVVVFAVKGHPGRGTRVLRQHGVWKMNAVLDFELI